VVTGAARHTLPLAQTAGTVDAP